jgi:hypothetical protein
MSNQYISLNYIEIIVPTILFEMDQVEIPEGVQDGKQ